MGGWAGFRPTVCFFLSPEEVCCRTASLPYIFEPISCVTIYRRIGKIRYCATPSSLVVFVRASMCNI